MLTPSKSPFGKFADKHEKHESKSQEKKEHMAKKMVVSGRGKKKDILNGLDSMEKNKNVFDVRAGEDNYKRLKMKRDYNSI